MDAIAFSFTPIASPESELAALKLVISVGGANVAAAKPELGQNYFVLPIDGNSTLRVEGWGVKKDPRLVRQFVVLRSGTG